MHTRNPVTFRSIYIAYFQGMISFSSYSCVVGIHISGKPFADNTSLSFSTRVPMMARLNLTWPICGTWSFAVTTTHCLANINVHSARNVIYNVCLIVLNHLISVLLCKENKWKTRHSNSSAVQYMNKKQLKCEVLINSVFYRGKRIE